MRCVIQRVTEASVTVDGKIIASIQRGLVVLVGITHSDTEKDGHWMADKLLGLRIFSDADGKMNLSLLECGFELLVVSQFTLYGDCKKGKRPSFIEAAKGEVAEPLFDHFIQHLKGIYPKVQIGQFGADMAVSLVNDGPVTLIVESK
jgi:D-tyrosyl-tRNA(Tyr) deacylase